jgi:hypothetical protein
MAIRNPGRIDAAVHGGARRGAASVHILVILIPVIFGLIGFAVDLGQLYMSRGELKNAANARALAAASQLTGTEAAVENANSAATLPVENVSGYGNRYMFGGFPIGETSGSFASEAVEPEYYENVADATGTSEVTGASGAGGTTARHVRVVLRGEAPITFWSFLSLAQERKVNLAAVAVAGISAPLCTACGIEPMAVAALNLEDTVHFGFTPGSIYTFGYQCTGGGAQPPLAGTVQRIPYLLLDHYNQGAQVFIDESTQLYRIGLQGLPGLPPTTENRRLACVTINDPTPSLLWGTAAGSTNANPLACNQNRVNPGVTNHLCGLAARLSAEIPEACATIPEIDSLAPGYPVDTDIALLDDYTAYTGNFRRIITVPVVETLTTSTDGMVVLGFRQFLLEPTTEESASINVSDSNGRFAALYIGTDARPAPVPLKQGTFQGCSVAAGPGKVVLHQ